MKKVLKFNCKHALCNSHNLRDLTFVHEEDKLIDHLIDIKIVVDCRGPIDSKLDLAEITEFEKRYDYIIKMAKLENPPPIVSDSQSQIKKTRKKKKTKAQNLLERLQKYRREVLAFMYDFEVPLQL